MATSASLVDLAPTLCELAGIEITALRETRAIGPGVVRRVLEHTLRGMYLPADQRRAVRPASGGGLPGLEVDGSAQGARTEVFAVGRGYYVYTIMIGADAKAWDKLRPMLEAAAHEVSEEDMLAALMFAQEAIGEFCKVQEGFLAKLDITRFGPGSKGDEFRGFIIINKVTEEKVSATLQLVEAQPQPQPLAAYAPSPMPVMQPSQAPAVWQFLS